MKKLLVVFGSLMLSSTLYAANMGPYFWDQNKAWVNGVTFQVNVSTVDLTITNDMAVGNDLSVTGDTALTGALGVTGTTTLGATVMAGSISMNQTAVEQYGIRTATLTVTGASSFTSPSGVSITYGVSAGSATIPILNGAIAAGNTITETYGINTATITVTGVATMSGGVSISTMTLTGVSVVTGTPSAAGKIVVDSNYLVYISTCSTDAGCWVKVGAQ